MSLPSSFLCRVCAVLLVLVPFSHSQGTENPQLCSPIIRHPTEHSTYTPDFSVTVTFTLWQVFCATNSSEGNFSSSWTVDPHPPKAKNESELQVCDVDHCPVCRNATIALYNATNYDWENFKVTILSECGSSNTSTFEVCFPHCNGSAPEPTTPNKTVETHRQGICQELSIEFKGDLDLDHYDIRWTNATGYLLCADDFAPYPTKYTCNRTYPIVNQCIFTSHLWICDFRQNDFGIYCARSYSVIGGPDGRTQSCVTLLGPTTGSSVPVWAVVVGTLVVGVLVMGVLLSVVIVKTYKKRKQTNIRTPSDPEDTGHVNSTAEGRHVQGSPNERTPLLSPLPQDVEADCPVKPKPQPVELILAKCVEEGEITDQELVTIAQQSYRDYIERLGIVLLGSNRFRDVEYEQKSKGDHNPVNLCTAVLTAWKDDTEPQVMRQQLVRALHRVQCVQLAEDVAMNRYWEGRHVQRRPNQRTPLFSSQVAQKGGSKSYEMQQKTKPALCSEQERGSQPTCSETQDNDTEALIHFEDNPEGYPRDVAYSLHLHQHQEPVIRVEQSSISASTSSDSICTIPDCPCQRDRCSYHDCLVSEFKSQHMTYADYGQSNNDKDMPDSPNHSQQKLALAKSVRIRKSDSTRNQSSQQSHLQIIGKLNPSVPFMDGIDVIECDSLGGRYYNPTCDFVLEIPGGAVPEGTTIQIEVGVTLYGPFQFPENVRPISPIVWLCVQPEGFEFLKPVKVILPHFLDLTNEENDSLELGFLKAGHHLNQHEKYQFMDAQNGKVTFQPEYGVIHTKHFCYLCLRCKAGTQLTAQSWFCLHRIVPVSKSITGWDIVFCVSFSLRLCFESVKQQYPERDFKITSKRFKFKIQGNGSEPKLKIHFNSHPPGGCQLVLEWEKYEITPSEVEFWNEEVDQMEFMHATKEYPPRFAIEVSGEQAVDGSYVEVSFTGIDDHYLGSINTHVPLVHPNFHIPKHTGYQSTSFGSESSSGFESSSSPVARLDPSNAIEISDILKKCGFSFADWDHLACRLCKEIDVKTIYEIRNPTPERCLQETIRQWLHKDPDRSWEKLAEAAGGIGHYGSVLTDTILKKTSYP